MIHVFLNPDGTQDAAVYALVLHSTGVCYSTQCAGLHTEIKGAEGFLIPLGGKDVAEPLTTWFWKTFRGLSSSPVPPWNERTTAELRERVEAVVCWYSDRFDGDDERLFLNLDESRLDECTEAWVPVETPYGKGILLFPNSD